MNGKVLFLITLVAALLISGVALAAGLADPEAGWRIGVALAGVWALWLVVLLYLGGGAITHRRDAGRAGTSIVLALLLTPLVLSAPAVSAAGSLISAVNDLGATTVDDATQPSTSEMDAPPADDFLEAPGAGLTEEDVEAFYLPDGVTRADLSDAEWQDFYDCVTTLAYPEECPIGDGE